MGLDGDPRHEALNGRARGTSVAAVGLFALAGVAPAPVQAAALLAASALVLRRADARLAGLGLTVAALLLLAAVLPPARSSPERTLRAIGKRLDDAETALDRALDRGGHALRGARDRRAAFAALERAQGTLTGGGVALYEAGKVVAWSGRTTALEGSGLEPGLALGGPPAGLVLVRVGRLPDGRSVAAELPVATVLAGLGEGVRLVPAAPGAGRGDVTPLAHARDALVAGVGPAAETETAGPAPALERGARAALALLLAFLGLRSLARARRGGLVEPACAGLLLVAARLAARDSWIETPRDLFGHSALAVVSPLDLFSSPGDLLLTGLLATALAVTFLRARPRGRRLARSLRLPALLLGLFLLALAHAGAVAGLFALVRRMADNSDLDLGDFSLLPFDGVRAAILLGTTLLAVAPVAAAQRLVRRGARALAASLPAEAALTAWLLTWSAAGLVALLVLGRPEGRADDLVPTALLFTLPAAATLLETRARVRLTALLGGLVLTSGLLVHAMTEQSCRHALRRFVESDLASVLKRHDATVRHLLEDVLRDAPAGEAVALAAMSPDEAAYVVWKRSALAAELLGSAVDVHTRGGRSGRFSFRLPLPPRLRPVNPGPITLQELFFQGRRIRVLAGTRVLADGARVTVRIAESQEGRPFFVDVHHLREVVLPGGIQHAEPLARADAVLTIVDPAGRVVHASVPPGVPADAAVIARALETEAPFWWAQSFAEARYDALSFAVGDRIFTISLPRRELTESVARLLHALLFLGATALLLALVLAALSPAFRRMLPGPSWALKSYERKTFLTFVAAAVLPAVASSLWLRSTIEARRIAEFRGQSVESLEFARRILAEFTAAEPSTPVDDSTLIWVSETVGCDLALFSGARLDATSMRDLFREGSLAGRPQAEDYRAVVLDGAPVHVRLRRYGEPIAVEAAAPLGEDGLLTLYGLTHATDIDREAEERNRLLFLATMALVAIAGFLARLVARRTTEPVRALTEAAVRVGQGDLDVRIPATRRDEVRTLIDSFNRMAEQLRDHRSRLDAHAAYLGRLLENATTGVVSVDAAGLVTTVNPAALELLGRSVAPGVPLARALDGPALLPLAARLATSDVPERDEVELSLATARGARTLRAKLIRLPLGEAESPGRLVLLEDVSEIVKSKKLEAWAEMARRIAHEIKNPLTPIQLAAEHALRVRRDGREGFDQVLTDCVATILRMVADLRRIAREFGAYAAGPAPVQRVETDVRAWLEESLAPYRLVEPPRVRIDLEVAPACGQALLDPARLRRALVNLVENSLQAMPQGGRVSVRARRELDHALILEVEDTGVGFPADVQGRLFEPYFSTKDVGTGLGLANVKQAVEDHGGTVRIESRPGEGTRVSIRLPQSPVPAAATVNPAV